MKACRFFVWSVLGLTILGLAAVPWSDVLAQSDRTAPSTASEVEGDGAAGESAVIEEVAVEEVAVEEAAGDAEPASTGDGADVSGAESAAAEEVKSELPAAAVKLTQTPVSELRLRVSPETAAQLESRRDALMAALQTVATELTDKIIQQQRLAPNKDAKDEFERVTKDVVALRELRSDVVSRTTVVLEALAAKGGDVESDQKYVSVVNAIEPQLSEGLEKQTPEESKPTKTPEELAQEDLAARVAEKIALVRDQPPVHERPEPWLVSTKELMLELEPLRVGQIKERVDKWITTLQREIRERIRIDIALENTDDAAEQQALAERSAEQQRVVLQIVTRIQAMLTELKARGGETYVYEQYITNATGQQLNVTNPKILYAQVLSWIKSPDGGVKIGIALLQFIGILIVSWIIARLAGATVSAALKRTKQSSTLLSNFLVSGVQRSILIIGTVVGVSVLGVNIGPMLAAIGALGLVIGLALQGTLSNFATGLLILIYRPFDVGDVVNAGGVTGKVDTVTLMSTRLLSFDNQVMMVPNNQIWGGVITNLTKLDTRRVDLVFGIGYADDIAKAEQIIADCVTAHPMVLEDPAPAIKVHELGDNSVNFVVRPWSKTSDYWDVYWDLTREIKQRFDAEGINIPFPQRDLHLDGPIEVVFGSGANSKADGPTTPTPATVTPQAPPHASQNVSEPGPADNDNHRSDD